MVSFLALHSVIYPRAVTEFVYRYTSPNLAHVFLSFILNTSSRTTELSDVLTELQDKGMDARDISDDEIAKSHVRYMVGGPRAVPHERVFRFGMISMFLLCARPFGTDKIVFCDV